jgi:hypothetical protein
MVRRGFLDIYPGQAYPPHLQSLVSGYATNQELLRIGAVKFHVTALIEPTRTFGKRPG